MGNKKLIPIKLDKDRNLLMDMNAMAAFENVTDHKNFFDFIQESKGKFTANELRAFLWSMLIHEDKDIKLEDVGAMIRTDNINEITDALLAAQTANVSDIKDNVPLAPTQA